MNFEQLIRKTMFLHWRPVDKLDLQAFAGIESETAMICEDEDHSVTYIADGSTLVVSEYLDNGERGIEIISELHFTMDPIGTELRPDWGIV
jgi:hypothetical protein